MAKNADELEEYSDNWQAYLLQQLQAYTAGMVPAKEPGEGITPFTTDEVLQALEPMIAGVTTTDVIDYLVGEGYEPKRVGNALYWLGRRRY